jgi:hypothetical protein
MKDKLNIYRVAPADTSPQRLASLGQQIFGLQSFQFSATPDARALRKGRHVVEVAQASGAIWAADEAQMWNPEVQAELPSDSDAVLRARDFLDRNQLLPQLAAPFAYAEPIVAGTLLATLRDGKREDRRLDSQVIFPVTVDGIPLVGGANDVKVTMGHQASVIGYRSGLRMVTGSFESKALDPEQVKNQYLQQVPKLKIESSNMRLAYYAAPSFVQQEFVYPVYIFSGTARFGKEVLPLRQVMLPATEFGPALQFEKPQPKRPRSARPRSKLRESDKPQQGRRSFEARTPTRPWEAGTEWIGPAGGLPGSPANAQGFVDEWAAAGWHIDFNWGDANAFESDWRRDDDNWVDNADFVFYTGHANEYGWVLSAPDDTFLHFSETGAAGENPGDLWGNSDLEWMTIAACGPLEDDLLGHPGGGGDALTRWKGAFDGMHILMGYGAITFDNDQEGRRLAQYAKGGSSLINAWFRAANEIQPTDNGVGHPGSEEYPSPYGPIVYAGAMWATQSGIDPFGDHAWDFGSVSGDPKGALSYSAMWVPC